MKWKKEMIKINIKGYASMIDVGKGYPKIASRKLRDGQRLNLGFSRYYGERPVIIEYGWVLFNKKNLPVIKANISDELWCPLVFEKKVPIYVQDLINRGYLEKRFANPEKWMNMLVFVNSISSMQ